MMNEPTMTVTGNVTRDPEHKVGIERGNDFAVIPIAVNRRKYDPTQEAWVTSSTTYVDLLAFGPKGATALASFKKGDPVIAHGRVSLREWRTENSSGAKLVLDVDSLGHDVSNGVSRFSKGWVSYVGDRVDDYDPSEAGGVVGALEKRVGAPAATGPDGPDGTGEPDEPRDAGEDRQDPSTDDLEVDEDGVILDDEKADKVFARSA